MWLDIRTAAEASDKRPVKPADLEALAKIPAADSAALADEIGGWWERKLSRPLWADTVVARVPGQGIPWLKVPRYPIWDEVPAVVPVFSDDTVGAAYVASTYRVGGRCRNLLYRAKGWPWTAPLQPGIAEYPAAGLELPQLRIGLDPADALVTGFRGGYVMPGQWLRYVDSTTWTAGASVSITGTAYGWAKSSDRSVPGMFEVTAGTQSIASEPTWPTTDGGTVVSGGATFTYRQFASSLPTSYVTASLKLAPSLAALRKDGECMDDDLERSVLAMARESC